MVNLVAISDHEGVCGVVQSDNSLGHCVFFFFFFQEEDGIRILVRSRGLGDVYKRQVQLHAATFTELHNTLV